MNTKVKITNLSTENLDKLKYKTPYYIIDKNLISDNINAFKKYLPGTSIHYAMKVNPNKEILKTLYKSGSKFEIASIGELKDLLICGINTADIIYSSPVKPSSYIAEAYSLGINTYTFDSLEELVKISKYAPGSNVCLRLKVSEKGSRFPLSAKFGTDKKNGLKLMIKARHLGLKVYGIGFHIGSQSTSLKTWESAIKTLSELVNELLSKGIKIKTINLGGGFPVKYTEDVPTVKDICQSINESVDKFLPYKVKKIIEPGRSLVATSAVLVTSIFSIIKRDNIWAYVDAGSYNSLFETLESQTSMNFKIRYSLNLPNEDDNESYTITGPTCDSLDILAKNVLLPKNLKVGDKLYFENAGAYSMALASRFNGFPLPRVYFIN